jgi:hypothetical protein
LARAAKNADSARQLSARFAGQLPRTAGESARVFEIYVADEKNSASEYAAAGGDGAINMPRRSAAL